MYVTYISNMMMHPTLLIVTLHTHNLLCNWQAKVLPILSDISQI